MSHHADAHTKHTADNGDKKSVRPPDKKLIDAFMIHRRERYKSLKARGDHGFVVFPPPKTQPKSHGQAVKKSLNTASEDDAPSKDLMDDLNEGILSHSASHDEKLQKQSTAHLLLRLLGLEFIEPLSSLDDRGLPENVAQSNYTAQDAADFMLSLVRDQPGVLDHVFYSRPNEALSSPFETTTLDVWLTPRIMAAVTVLDLRQGGALPSSKHAAELKWLLLQLGQEVLAISVATTGRNNKVRQIMKECIRSSLRALSSIGKSSFLPSLPPPLWLAPRPADLNEQPFTYFQPNSESLSSMNTKCYGDGIGRLWMYEDHATYQPPWLDASQSIRSTLSNVLFLNTCALCIHQTKQQPESFVDFELALCSLVVSNWSRSLQLDEQASLPKECHSEKEVIRIYISNRASLPIYQQRFATLIAKALIAVVARKYWISANVVQAITSSLDKWEKRSQRGNEVLEAMAILKSSTRLLVDQITRPISIDTSGIPHTLTDKKEKDADICVKNLALDALLFTLNGANDLRTSLDLESRAILIQMADSEDLVSATPEDQGAGHWLSEDKRNALINILRVDDNANIANGQATPHIDDAPSVDLLDLNALQSLPTSDPLCTQHKYLHADDAKNFIVMTRYFCAKANQLRRVHKYAKGVELQCNVCDNALHKPELSIFEQTEYLWRLDELTRILHQVRNNVCSSGDAFALSVRRALNHRPRSIDSLAGQDISRFADFGLTLPRRSDRLVAAKSVADLVGWVYSASAPTLNSVVRSSEIDKLFRVTDALLRSAQLRKKETTIVCLAYLGDENIYEVRQKALLQLVLQLGSDTLSKALAYTTITQLAMRLRCTTFQLLSPYLDIIGIEVVERMSKSPMLFLEVLQLTRQNQSKFLQTTLHFALPKLVQMDDDKNIALVAKGIGCDVQSMCFNNAPAVLKALLMVPNANQRDRSVHNFIRRVRGDTIHDITLKSLIKAYSVELLGHLVSFLGNPPKRRAALEGLHYINSALNERHRMNHSSSSKDLALSSFLKNEILAILSWLNDELMDAHGRKSMLHKAMVTRSVGVLIETIGQSISNVTSQLMASFNTTMQESELINSTLESWSALITTLRHDDLGPCVGPTVSALLQSWSRFGPVEKNLANAMLVYIIVDSPTDTSSELQRYLDRDLPLLDKISTDIPEVWRKLTHTNFYSKRTREQRLKNIVARASSDNSSMCSQALEELKQFLQDEQEYMEQVTTGNAFDEIVSQTMSVLFDAASRDDDYIRQLSLENLSIIGAIDPDRMPASASQHSKWILHDFTNREEITEFALHLIRSILVGAFKATNDTKHQAALAYVIQELLKFCGFTSSLLPSREGQSSRGTVNLRTRQRWNDMVDYIDTLAPLLESRYSVQHGDTSERSKPVYLNTDSFKQWIQSWTNDLILGVQGELADSVFGIFRTVIRDHDLSIAQYILPHLVVNIVTLGTDEQRQNIEEEIVAILEDQVENFSEFEPERRMRCAQVIFSLLDHLSIWQRSIQREKQRNSRSKRYPVDAPIQRVNELMGAISQDLMAKASLQCRAYARSLLNYEQQIRSLRQDTCFRPQEQKEANIQQCFEDMHLVYANLDEPDGMEGVSAHVLLPSLEHQIREHESTGRWTSAQSCWEVKIQENPNNLEYHIGLLGCLQSLGHYDTMRTHIRGVLAMHPEWEVPLDPFFVEGCCILSDWDEVRRSLSKSVSVRTGTPQHAMARVMLAMHDSDSVALRSSIRDARWLFGKPLIAAQKTNYVGAYDAMTQLHMLYELELIGKCFGMYLEKGQQMSLEALSKSLAHRFESTLPSFRTREPLLSLRRSAYKTQGRSDFRDMVAQSWVTSSKIARRAGHNQTAYSAALQASQWKASLAFVQQAKLLAMGDQKQAALQEMVNSLKTIQDKTQLRKPYLHSFANAHLFLARLSDESGKRRPNDIIELYRRCTDLDPLNEKMWYHLGHYYDHLLERDTSANIGNPIVQHLQVCKSFLKSAVLGTKFFYRTVPRMLTIWLTYGDDEKFISAQRKSKERQDSASVEPFRSFMKMNEVIQKAIDRIASYQWLAVLPQLVSRVTHKNDLVWNTLRDLICHVLQSYPDQAMWTMVAGCQSNDKERRARVLDIVNRAKTSSKSKPNSNHAADSLDHTLRIAKELLYLCDYHVPRDTKQLSMKSSFPELLKLAQTGKIMLPLQSSLSVALPSSGTAKSSHHVFHDNLPRIKDIDNTVDILSSLQRPRKLVVIASDGKSYAFLCKPKDDLRKDARLMEFDTMINNLLQSNSESRKRRLYIRTYSVVTLNEECGFIEWVPNTVGLRQILHQLYHARGIALYSQQIKADLDSARQQPKKAADIFEEKVLKKFPPVFHEWFITLFPEPSAWLEARLNYARTLAVMSMVGYVLGLGDRHGENILFDSMTGDTVHVDLNCLFDKGTTFEIPERVPFRLTQNLVDALGVTGCEGAFRRAAEISMAVLRDNKDSLMSVLEAMVHDPLVEWGIDDRASKGKSASSRPDPRIVEARKSLAPVAEKLNGRLKRTTHGDSSSSTWSASHSTNSLVDALMRDATSSSLLAQMYVGWASYL